MQSPFIINESTILNLRDSLLTNSEDNSFIVIRDNHVLVIDVCCVTFHSHYINWLFRHLSDCHFNYSKTVP